MLNGIGILVGTLALLVVAFLLLDRYAKGWRTVVMNALQAVPVIGGAIATELQTLNVEQYISEKNMLWYLGAVLLGNIVFRLGTSSKVGER